MSRDTSQGIDPSMQYLSTGFKGNGTDTTLTRMLGQDVNSKPQFCSECGKKCDAAYKPPGADNKSVEVYCKEHYEELFSSKCEGCNKPIMGTFRNVGGKKFHEQCYSQDASCGNCRQVIIGEAVEACNKHWHPKCFKCTLCYTPLGSSFIEKSNLPYCHKCASAPPASSGGRVINESSTVLDPAKKKEFETKNQTTKELSQNIREGKMFCAECGKMIGVGEAVSIQDSTFHLACFVCSKCKTPLANVGFKETNGEFFCGPCSGGGSAAAGGFCGGCGQKLSGQYLNAMGSKWHKQCFVCTSCKAPFSGGYAEKEGQPYCASCIQKNQKVSTTTQHYGERKPGFTVDPRSGTKKFGN